MKKHDVVNHPTHYNSHPSGVECIDVVEWMPFNIGSAIKYLWRCGKKGSALEDLRKAAWLIQREITRVQKKEYHPIDGGRESESTTGTRKARR